MENRDRLAIAQGAFFAATGLWPLLHLRSFEKITGPKAEGWLVQTAGALITVIGATLFCAGLERRVTPEIERLGCGAALALAGIDVIHAGLRRRISPVYLLDAAAELAIAGGWIACRRLGLGGRYVRWYEMPAGWDYVRATS